MQEGSSRYQPIKTCIWTDEKFVDFPDDLKLLWLYLLTSPHSNMIGLYRLPEEYGATDLRWDMKRFRERFAELSQNGFVGHDPQARVVLIKNQLKHRPLSNSNQEKAAIKTLETIPDTFLFNNLLENITNLAKPFTERLGERLGERYAKYITVNREPLTVNRKPKEKDLKSSVAAPENQEHRRLAFLLHLKIKSRNPGQKDPNWKVWTREVTRMVEVDNRDTAEIERIINWCQADEFWRNNILSTAKLREQFDQLVLKSRNSKGQEQAPAAGTDLDDWKEIERKQMERQRGTE